MTDRINSLTVVLKDDIRDDDVMPIVEAIGMIRGVLKVEQHVVISDSYVAVQRVRAELAEKLFEALK